MPDDSGMSEFVRAAETAAFLKRLPLFSGLEQADVEKLSRIAIVKSFHKNELIFPEGERLAGFYVAMQGQVKIYKVSNSGKEQTLHIVFPGQTFAEAALFGDGRVPANATALTESKALFIFKEDLLRLIKERPQFAINLIVSLSQYLKHLTTVIDEVTLKEVPARLAGYILELEPRSGRDVKIPVPKKELAVRLGTVSETLSRAFLKLKQAKAIKVAGNRVTVLDRKKLERLAADF